MWYLKGRLDADRLKPILGSVLRLATRILNCSASYRYFFNLLESPREDLRELSQHFNTQASSFRNMKDVPFEVVQEKVDRALDRLLLKIRFILLDPAKDIRMAALRGLTEYV